MAKSNNISLDFNVIYNKALSPLSLSDDEKLSLEFTEFLVAKLKGWDFQSGYYGDRDAVPGKNIFTALNENVRNSSKTIVVITPGFLRNCWSKYQHQNAFKFLLDKDNSDRLVPIALDIQPNEVPHELNIQTMVFFSKTSYIYQESNKEWDKLRMAFDENFIAENRVYSMPHAQEHGDNRTRSARDNLVTHPKEGDAETGITYSTQYKETEYSTSTMRKKLSEEVTMDLAPTVTSVVITQGGSSMTIPLPPVRPSPHVSPPSNLKTDNSNIKAPEVEKKVTSTVSYTSQYSLSKDMDIETDQLVQKQVQHLSTDISHGQTAPPNSSDLSQVLEKSQGNLRDERKPEASKPRGKDFTDARTKIIEDEINIDESVLPDITTDHTSNDSTNTVRKTMYKAEDTSSLYQPESELQLIVTSSLSLDSLNQLSSGYASYTSSVKEEVMMRQEQDVTEIQKVVYKRQEPDGSDDLKLGALSLGRNRGTQSEKRASSASMFGFGRGQRDQNNGWFNYAIRILSRPELAFN